MVTDVFRQGNRLLLLLPLLLGACGSSRLPAPPPEPVFADAPRVGAVALVAAAAPADYQLLDVGIAAFSNQYRDSDSAIYGDWIFSEIRDNERHFLPWLLRQTLQDSNQWGAVRVLPLHDPATDLSIEGTIHQSDGTRLVVEIQASDSTGKVWLNRLYVDHSRATDYPDSTRLRSASQLDAADLEEPFADLYRQISNDLVAVRDAMSRAELINIRRVSQLVYANDLSPESFADSLAEDEQGLLQVVSLPAEDDPMATRVAEMRRRHHLFIDTVDDYYQALFEQMEASYLVWRRYSYDQIEEFDASSQLAVERGWFRSADNTLSIIQRYNRYRWSKIYQQEFLELAGGFNREIAPAILELNKNVHGLSGTMEEQYIQWRRILRQLFALEVGEVRAGADFSALLPQMAGEQSQ